MISDEKIIETAKELKLPVADKRIYENEVNSYNYIIVKKGTLRKTSPGHFVRQIEIIYVFESNQEKNDFEIINKFQNIGLQFIRLEPDEVQVQKTNTWVEINTYIFERPEIDNGKRNT